MRKVLADRGLQLTKSLGQNFLHDGNQLRKLATLAELKPQDFVLEIGPGLGPLTELLVERAGRVLAIETDVRLVAYLQERFRSELQPPPVGKLELMHADALEYLRTTPRDWANWKLVANLPYSVASPILVELAQTAQRPERLVATLQSEVADRLMANPGDGDYGLLTVLVQLDYSPAGKFKIPASCFFPEPNVDSSSICLVRRAAPLIQPGARRTFYEVVKRGFGQRRKMLMKLLKAKWKPEELEPAFRKANIDPQVRAERLSVQQFVSLAEDLAPKNV